MNIRDFPDTKGRREALEKEFGLQLPQIASYTPSLEIANTKNCENMIGAAQVPMGIAGPLAIQNQAASSKQQDSKNVISSEARDPNEISHSVRNDTINYYLPLATTEGALVASISRGCKAITQAGGAIVSSYKAGMTRGPVFYTGSLANKAKLEAFLINHKSLIINHAEQTSHHLKLKDIIVKSFPNYSFLRFSYDTGDAMGMNMATIATQAACEFIEEKTGIPCVSVAGNFDTDKKPAWINALSGRGMKVWAEVVLPKTVVLDILKTTPQKFFDVWLAKVMLGSAAAGSMGFNAHIANVLAALFIATGQDPAHVVDGSIGVTTAKVLENGDLYVGVYLPSLLVGTVGGGMMLPTQSEALKILGVLGEGKVEEFAQVIAGACLAGEVSLLASLSEGTLASSHKRLGRSKEI